MVLFQIRHRTSLKYLVSVYTESSSIGCDSAVTDLSIKLLPLEVLPIFIAIRYHRQSTRPPHAIAKEYMY